MNVKDLRTLVDNLEEYIHVPGGIERLKKTILHLAVSGKLVPQDPSEGTGEELYEQIQLEKAKLIIDGKLKKQEPLTKLASDEEPFEIPRSWNWLRLGDIIQVSSGSFLPSSKMAEDFEYPVYGGNGISGYYEKFLYPKPVIVIGRVGAQCGNVHMTLPNAWVTDNAFVVRYTDAFMYSEYLVLALRQLDLKSTHKGSAQPVISGRSIYQLPFQLPPLDEQVRIMDKVKDVFLLIDDLAERYRLELVERRKLVVSSFAKFAKGESDLALDQLTEIIKTKEDAAELRKTILHLAVSGKLVPQDPSEGTGEELYEQIQLEKAKLIADGKLKKQKPLPEISEGEVPFSIPESWKWVRLASATVFSIGRTPARKEGSYWDEEYMPWISIADLKAGQKISRTKEYISKKAFEKCFSNEAVPAGSLLYSFKLTIGKMSITEMDAVHNEAIASFTTLSDAMTQYLFKALEVIDPTKRSKGAIMGNTLNSSSLSLLEIPLPPAAEQIRIVQKATQLLDLVNQLERHMEK